jgi:hypothetical protein
MPDMAKLGYTEELGDEINRLIAEGKPLIAVCEELHLAYSTVRRWLSNDEQFARAHAQARKDQADTLFDQIITLSDKTHQVLPNGNIVPRDPQWAKLQTDNRRWVVGKLDPDRFADRVNVNHSGSINVTGMDREALLSRLQELAERGVPVPDALLLASPSEEPIDAEFEDIVPAGHPGEDLC